MRYFDGANCVLRSDELVSRQASAPPSKLRVERAPPSLCCRVPLGYRAGMGFALTPAEDLARQLGISVEAVELARSSPFVDLHCDSFIWTRLFGYDLNKRHEVSPTGGRLGGHLDFPRAVDAGLSGAMWVITTNPFRSRRSRWKTFQKNLARWQAQVAASGGAVRQVARFSEYQRAASEGVHAALAKIQGGNALCPQAGYADGIPGDVVTCVTVVHLTHSFLGRSSTPLPGWRGPGLTGEGRDLVRSLNEHRIFVDLAHIHPSAFREVLEVHDRSQPLIDTHTGVQGVRPHWRNLDDEQLRAIADTGGVVGVIFQASFLRAPGGPSDVGMVVDHIDHIVKVAGIETPAIGTDYDGAITPPPGLRNGLHFPRLVQALLDRGYGEEAIRKILGENFLRSFRTLRP